VSQRAHRRKCTHGDPPSSDGIMPGARGRLACPRQCLRVDVFPDVRHFAISNGNVEDRNATKWESC
jgi:hypothetical protein